MGSRKHKRAEEYKEARKSRYVARLNNNPTSPRKTRLMADAIRGLDVNKALGILQYSHRESAPKLRKLLLSAIANWQAKNVGKSVEDSNLFVKQICVNGGRQLKRLRTAPQGRGYRIRKRSNHIILEIGSRNDNVATPQSNDAENK
ncbi:MAG: 50S ribosomal protein L22 [Synergistales bacterium]|jgi:large subunit ribosomal protein L22|nr:50S ribosomal protein L22 [Bacteroidales bacterium]MDY6434860.1 50S ribosomal protein L22 [Synergistales bacterium]MBQ6753659.1 50S ribosomal protein L22 [Bacteroidales bacterium]MDY6381409.1 50S ribosomal protein L22 [Bacteroidales bacterium]MDY6394245.1 50S ribosomal protein L22 [Bacteroidales bacterium]